MNPTSHPALGLARRFFVVLAIYALVMQAFFAAAVAAQAAAWGGAGATVICRGNAQPGDTRAPLPENHAADCALACAAVGGAAIVPAAGDSAIPAAWVFHAGQPLLAPLAPRAAQDRDGDARAPPAAV